MLFSLMAATTSIILAENQQATQQAKQAKKVIATVACIGLVVIGSCMVYNNNFRYGPLPDEDEDEQEESSNDYLYLGADLD